jgi:hypothetical protein
VVRVVVEPGQPVLVGDVDIELRGFVPADKGSAPIDAAALRQGWGMGTGTRFRTADWEAAKRGILRQITQRASRAPSCSNPAPRSTRTPTAPCSRSSSTAARMCASAT